MLTRSFHNKQKNKLISATRISNWVKNDPIIDYLDLINENKLIISSELEITKKRARTNDYDNDIHGQEKKSKSSKTSNTSALSKTSNTSALSKTSNTSALSNSSNTSALSNSSNTSALSKTSNASKSSFDYIVESGNLFELDIIVQIENKMIINNEYKKMIKITESNINLNYSETIKMILSNKYSIILGGVLINEKNNSWGKPDLIIKGEWINKYIEVNIPNINSNKWYIIDIKSSTVNLISGGDEMSSKLLYNAYKSQIYIYTDALNESLKKYNKDNNVDCGFILGKKYKYVVNKNTIIKKPFEYLGIVDFTADINGQSYVKIVSDAIRWNNELRKNWKDYKLNPINKNELYPNMKNHYDKNWYKIKKDIGVANREITLLWNCGIANRKLAWEAGIKRYDDVKLNAQILGFEGKSKETIIDLMLGLTNSDKKYILNKYNDYMEWQSISDFEFFVDFETYNTDIIWDENNDWENSLTTLQKIYMIGVSYIMDNKIVHKSFLIKYQNHSDLKKQFDDNNKFDDVKFNDCIICSSEVDLIKKFSEFVISFKPSNMNLDFFKKNIRLCHWSGAEPIMFNKKIREYNLDKDEYDFNWYDLLKIFKHDRYPIIIKECFGFGLKEIIKTLNKYGLINLSWSDLDDGLLSSFIARDIYIGVNSKPNIEMFNIIEYNYYDCKALYLLLDWMRSVVN